MTTWRQDYFSSPKIALILLLALEGLTLTFFYFVIQSVRSYVTLVNNSQEWASVYEVSLLIGSVTLFVCALTVGIFLLVRTFRDLQMRQVREEFMNAVSHDLKTPLTLMQLYGETLLYHDDLSEDDRRTYSRIIVRQSKRLTNLIDQVLDLSRIEKAHKSYCLQEGDLAPVVVQTVEDYGEHLRQQGFSVEMDITHHVPQVRFDENAVSQAVMNLLDNARKYSRDSKSIAVRLWSENDQVIVEVQDHGIGIPKEVQKEVFQPFYRVSSNGSSMKRGHGLGLFLVWHTMHAHGGKIEVKSGRERGSRFRLVFPVMGKSAPSPFSGLSLHNTLRIWGH
ncbi:MAG: HAMP domain-containing sensor histidine kinase [Acidobacteria bacterium]|nr:HAMP domain-containing sensor histidine kinase [Acidobacteriota bacterium]